MRRPDELAGGTRAAASHELTTLERDLRRIDTMARLMDAQFRLPIIGIRVGLDGIVGLVPGVGDVLMTGPSAWMIAKGWQHGARRRTILRMAANSSIDFLIGSIPLIGDIFDVAFKANLKNARLLRQEFERSR